MTIEIPQDVVLDRVTKFAANKGYPFWIDKLCIDQREGSDEKEIAIQSMDLIYKQSKISLGLLFVRLDEEKQVKRLHALLDGSYATREEDKRGNVKYILTNAIKEARVVLSIIELIVKDSWWDRAWIFQEEYLSQLRMRLLIRSSVYYGRNQSNYFGDIPGELQVVATDFRTEATTLCLAVCEHPQVSADDKHRCAEVLKRAGKYTILLTQEGTLLGKTLKAMSPVIFRDIGNRGISDEWDILPIASNTCDYSERLDTRKLQVRQQEHEKSLSLAILTTYILNGEILRHDSTQDKCFDSSVFDFLERNTMRVYPPLDKEKGLTFIKHCRFSNIILSRHGMETEGVIWKLKRAIRISPSFVGGTTSYWLRKKTQKYGPQKSSGFRYHLSDSEITALWRLVGWLRYDEEKLYEHLAERLCNFLKNIAQEGFDDDWTYRHVMSIMATNVARAIQENKQLRLGCIDRSSRSPYSAIFVEDATDFDDECYIFTSWTCVEEIVKGDLLATSCAKYASLETALSKPNNCLPTITPKRWINGLCFFSNSDAQKVVIPWPRSLGG